MRCVIAWLLSLASCTVWADEQAWFEHKTLGFKIQKPSAWYFVPDELQTRNLANTQLTNDTMKKLVQRYTTNPLVVMMKQPTDINDVYPSVKVKVKPLLDLKNFTPVVMLERTVTEYRAAFQQFEWVQRPTSVQLSGTSAAYVRFNYSMFYMNNPSNQGFPLTLEMWLVPQGAYGIMISAITRQDEKTGSRQEIADILSSVELFAKPY